MLVPLMRLLYAPDGSSGTPKPAPAHEPPSSKASGPATSPAGEPQPQAQPNIRYSILPEYSKLPMEVAISQTIQHYMTPKDQEIKQLNEKVTKFDTYLDSIAALKDNKQARLAFIRELEPDLIKPVDVRQEVSNRMSLKNYPKDFKPSREEADNDPMSDSAWYYRDLETTRQEVLKEMNGGGDKTYAEIVAEAGKKREEKVAADQQELANLVTKYNISDAVQKDFLSKVKNFKLEDMYLYYLNINNFTKTPNLTDAKGSVLMTSNDKWNKATELFGNPVNLR